MFAANDVYGESKNAFTSVQVCKAALASIMGVAPKSIKSKKRENGVVYLYYLLEGKSEIYGYKCKLKDNRIIWGSAMGRWRTQKDDMLITFKINNKSITIKERFNDESESEATNTTFSQSQL